jgi:N-methylhydantoinase A
MLENSCELAQINVVAIGASERPALARLTETGVAEPSSVRGVFFADAGWVDSEVYLREKLGAGAELRGPAVIAEPDSTTVVHPDQLLTVDEYGLLHLEAVSVGAERSLKVAL